MKPHLEIGYVRAAHGTSGELSIKTFDPASDALLEVDRLLLRLRDGSERLVTLAEVREGPKGFLVRLEKIAGRPAAEALVGSSVLVFREDLPPPEEHEYFQGDLVGLEAQTEDGAPLGQVEALFGPGEVPNLVLRTPDGGELMIPFVDDFIVRVELEAGRIVLRPPEYA